MGILSAETERGESATCVPRARGGTPGAGAGVELIPCLEGAAETWAFIGAKGSGLPGWRGLRAQTREEESRPGDSALRAVAVLAWNPSTVGLSVPTGPSMKEEAGDVADERFIASVALPVSSEARGEAGLSTPETP
jgi:hypothetical protein